QFCDPGYGYASRGSNNYTIDAVVSNSKIIDNKRKGLDAHAGVNIAFINNFVQGNLIGGVYAVTGSLKQKVNNITIEGNTLINNATAKGALGAIYIGASANLKGNYNDLNTKIANNIIDGYTKFGINIRFGSNISLNNNIIKNGQKGFGKNLYAISLEGNGKNLIDRIYVNENSIDHQTKIEFTPMRLVKVKKAAISNNKFNHRFNHLKSVDMSYSESVDFDKNSIITGTDTVDLMFHK